MNYLLVNLAASDITVAIFIAARYIFPLLFEHPKGRAGDVVCQLFTGEAVVWVGALTSAFSLICIALERYLAIKFPYDERKRLTTAKLKCVIVFSWVLATSWNLPLFLYARYDPVSEFCLFQWPTTSFAQVHSPLCVLFYGVLPISIMSYLYSKLVLRQTFFFKHIRLHKSLFFLISSSCKQIFPVFFSVLFSCAKYYYRLTELFYEERNQ